jgi:ethanolamine utilization protein EutQ
MVRWLLAESEYSRPDSIDFPMPRLCGTLPGCYDASLIMPTLISQPTRIESAGNKPKIIEEYVGRVNTSTGDISVARMHSPEGWEEPGQTPEFDEYTVVLRGTLRVRHKSGELDVTAGQAVIVHRGEWIRYSTPFSGGAEYIALCLPAFSPDTVHRDR